MNPTKNTPKPLTPAVTRSYTTFFYPKHWRLTVGVIKTTESKRYPRKAEQRPKHFLKGGDGQTRCLACCMDSSHKRRWYSVSALSRLLSLFSIPFPFFALVNHSSSSSSCAARQKRHSDISNRVAIKPSEDRKSLPYIVQSRNRYPFSNIVKSLFQEAE